jgi:hypothetical protein
LPEFIFVGSDGHSGGILVDWFWFWFWFWCSVERKKVVGVAAWKTWEKGIPQHHKSQVIGGQAATGGHTAHAGQTNVSFYI